MPLVGQLDLVAAEVAEAGQLRLDPRVAAHVRLAQEAGPRVGVGELGRPRPVDHPPLPQRRAHVRARPAGPPAPLRQRVALDRPGLGRPVDPDRQPVAVAHALAPGVAQRHGHRRRHEAVLDPVLDRRRPRGMHQPLHAGQQVVLLGHQVLASDQRRADEPRVPIGHGLRAVAVEVGVGADIGAEVGVVALLEPALQVAHAVVDHLRLQAQQVEIEQRRVQLALGHLRLDAVDPAAPVEVVVALAQQRPAMCPPQQGEQLGVPGEPPARHRRQRLARVVLQVDPGRRTHVHVEVARRRAEAAVDLGRGLPHEAHRVVRLERVALHARALVEPSQRRRAVRLERPQMRLIARRIGVQVDVVLVDRPRVAQLARRVAKQLHPLVATIGRVGRQVVRQLHVVAVALPVVLDDDHVVDAAVLQPPQQVRVTRVAARLMAPDIEHDQRRQQLAVRRDRVRQVRQRLGQVRRDRDVALLAQRVARAVGLRVVGRLALRRAAGVALGPVQPAPGVQPRRRQVEQRARQVRHLHAAPPVDAGDLSQAKRRCQQLVRLGADRQRAPGQAQPPSHRRAALARRVAPIDADRPRLAVDVRAQRLAAHAAHRPLAQVEGHPAARRRLERRAAVDFHCQVVQRPRRRPPNPLEARVGRRRAEHIRPAAHAQAVLLRQEGRRPDTLAAARAVQQRRQVAPRDRLVRRPRGQRRGRRRVALARLARDDPPVPVGEVERRVARRPRVDLQPQPHGLPRVLAQVEALVAPLGRLVVVLQQPPPLAARREEERGEGHPVAAARRRRLRAQRVAQVQRQRPQIGQRQGVVNPQRPADPAPRHVEEHRRTPQHLHPRLVRRAARAIHVAQPADRQLDRLNPLRLHAAAIAAQVAQPGRAGADRHRLHLGAGQRRTQQQQR